MSKQPHMYAVVAAAVLLALAVSPILPATLTAETETRSADAVSAKAPDPPAERTPEPPPTTDEKIEKLSLKKLTIKEPPPEKPAPEKAASKKPPSEKPAPAREPDRDRGSDRNKKPEQAARGSATDAPALPGPAPAKRPAAAAPPAAKPAPRDNRLLLSIPRLRLENIVVGDSPRQAYLDREGLMHLSGTGFPRERGSNTYIAGHADYNASRIPSIFRNLHNLRQGDRITLRDAEGKTYDYHVYERFTVAPHDVWVTEPIAGERIVSLQTCFPAPTFEKRLIVRGVLVE